MWALLILLYIIVLPRDGASIVVQITKLECEINNKYCNNEFCFLKTVRQRMNLLNYGCYFFEPINHFMLQLTVERVFNKKYAKFYDYTTDGCKLLQGSSASPIMSRLLEKATKYINFPKSCPFKGNVTIINCPVDATIFPNLLPRGHYRSILHAFVVGKYKNETLVKSFTYMKA